MSSRDVGEKSRSATPAGAADGPSERIRWAFRRIPAEIVRRRRPMYPWCIGPGWAVRRRLWTGRAP